MIKNIVFDIGNVILNFRYKEVVKEFSNNKEEQDFIVDNIINSPEWLQYGLIDTGYIDRNIAISLIQDRTNHKMDNLVYDFWMNYPKYLKINKEVIDIIIDLKNKNYNIYLLSNINPYITKNIKETSNLFDLVDGYILSYEVHQIKPYEAIYKKLINTYKINPEESLFIDDNLNNINTGKRIGFISKKVEQDDVDSVRNALKNI